MIGKTIYADGRNYLCDDCNRLEKFQSIEAARAAGWAIARNRKNCYCPDCAPARRNVGKAWGGVRTMMRG